MNATDILKEEHRAIERMLNVLETLLQKERQGARVSPEPIRDALRFIVSFADRCHHGKEEELLFPAMERKGFSKHAGPLAVMMHEHEAGRTHVRSMYRALEQYESGNDAAWDDLQRNAAAFVSLLREHIQKEDHILFVMADQQLSADEQSELLHQFRNIEVSGEVCRTKADLLATLERLEREVFETV